MSSNNWSDELAHQLESEQQKLTSFLGAQRRQVEGLEATLAAQLGSLAGHLAARLELEHQQMAEKLAHRTSLLEARAAKLVAESEELEQLRVRTREQRRRLAEQFQNDRWARAANSPNASRLQQQLEQVEAERDVLAGQVAALEQQGNAAHPTVDLEHEIEHLQRRLQRALDDVRDLTRRNVELEQQAATRAGKAPATVATGPLDWEAQKRILLASLEADEPTTDQQRQERLTIDGTIRITDTIVQEKDREIIELQQLLTEQSQSVGAVAVGAAALGEIFDQDEMIQQERERLSQLQREWEQKLRMSEIDISVERAKVARERADLCERQRMLDDQAQAQRREGSVEGTDAGKSPPNRGRWLSRLGLKDKDEEK